MKTIYSLRLARFLIEKGFYCHGSFPNPKKPWMNAYKFDNSPELEQAISLYLKRNRKESE